MCVFVCVHVCAWHTLNTEYLSNVIIVATFFSVAIHKNKQCACGPVLACTTCSRNVNNDHNGGIGQGTGNLGNKIIATLAKCKVNVSLSVTLTTLILL